MDLNLKDRLFIVGGSTSGFGRSVALALVDEEANIIAIARSQSPLEKLKSLNPQRIETVNGDLTDPDLPKKIMKQLGSRTLDGIFVNSGGPPAKAFSDTTMKDWDVAYKTLLRWKVDLIKQLLPLFTSRNYGRILFCESASVKQPIANLILSNSLRLAVVGMAKTLSDEVANKDITVNILAPGFHNTPAMDRLFENKCQLEGITIQEAKAKFEKEVKSGRLGDPSEFASLAVWLLSPGSGYITGQTISVDGGLIRSVFG
jgi:3-oxoacyl-[acyl-carrier protein] reductase